MILSPRLETIVSFVKEGSIVADIGTDHGYIPAFLVKEGICKKAIATDISRGSLQKAKKYINENKLNDFIDLRLGDGLEIIKPNEVDTIILSGMGGALIKDILEKNKNVVDTISNLILQPMIASDELRKYLYNNGFKIKGEKLAREEDRFYEIIYAIHGDDFAPNDIYYEIGIKLIQNKDPLFKEFILNKIQINEKIIQDLKDVHSEKSEKRHIYLINKNKEYMEVLKAYEG